MKNQNLPLWTLVVLLVIALFWNNARGQGSEQSYNCTMTWRDDGGFDQFCVPADMPAPTEEVPTSTPLPAPSATPPPSSTSTTYPTETATPIPTNTPLSLETPAPSSTPAPLPTDPPAPTPTATTSAATAVQVTIDRSAVPSLYYNDLSLVIDIGSGNTAVVMGDGELAYREDTDRGVVVVTTSGTQFRVDVSGTAPVPGTVSPALLKDEKAWAWSVGLDDNVNQKQGIALMRQAGVRATIYPIADRISDTRDEGWIIDAPYLRDLLTEGWSLGNHTWDHNCNNATITETTVTTAYERLRAIVNASAVPDYRMIGFASPCFSSGYNPIIEGMVARGENEVLFNESGPGYLLDVSPGAPDNTYIDGRAVAGWTPARRIGRDGNSQASRLATMDWVAAQATPARPFWYNVLIHTMYAADIQPYLDKLVQYQDSVWAAPADEIYSYLLVRETAVVTSAVLP